MCPATQYHFSSSKHDSNRLLYSPVSHETRRHAKLRSEWSGNHVWQTQPCRIRFYLKSAQYLCSFVFFSIFITFVYVSYTRFTKLCNRCLEWLQCGKLCFFTNYPLTIHREVENTAFLCPLSGPTWKFPLYLLFFPLLKIHYAY